MNYNTLRISGELVCDYIWYVNDKLSYDDEKLISDISYEPSWSKNTALLVKFNDSLMAGNIDDGDTPPTQWKIYRKEVNDDTLKPVTVINEESVQIVDYNITNNRTYVYSIVAATSEYITGAILSKPISTNWLNWSLFSVDETDTKNEFTIRDIFNFEYNISPSQLSNNISATKYNNFTKFPKIIKGNSNYYSGSLQCLLGYYDCTKNEYIDSADMLDYLSNFTTDGRRKFLKDIYGHIWEVEITDALSATANHHVGGSYYDIKVGWTQVGDTEGLSILGAISNE